MNKKLVASIIIGLITSIAASIIYDKLFKKQQNTDAISKDRITVSSDGGEVTGVTNIINNGSIEIKNKTTKP